METTPVYLCLIKNSPDNKRPKFYQTCVFDTIENIMEKEAEEYAEQIYENSETGNFLDSDDKISWIWDFHYIDSYMDNPPFNLTFIYEGKWITDYEFMSDTFVDKIIGFLKKYEETEEDF